MIKRKSLQPQQLNSSFSKTKSPLTQVKQLKGSTQLSELFSFTIQGPVSESDVTCCWEYNVPILSPNQKQIFLITQSFQTTLLDFVGQNFPQKICLALRNFNGYMNKQGIQTNKFIVLELVSTSIKTVNGLTSRDLIYRSQLSNNWSLGSLRSLKMEMYLNDNTIPVQFPINSEVSIQFKVLHVVY